MIVNGDNLINGNGYDTGVDSEIVSKSTSLNSMSSSDFSASLDQERVFNEYLPEPKEVVTVIHIPLPGYGDGEKHAVHIQLPPWVQSFEQRYKHKLSILQRQNILKRLQDDEAGRRAFLDRERHLCRGRDGSSINSNDIEYTYSASEEHNDEDQGDEASVANSEEDELDLTSAHGTPYWLPYMLSNDVFYFQRTLQVMYGWAIPPSPARVFSAVDGAVLSQDRSDVANQESMHEKYSLRPYSDEHNQVNYTNVDSDNVKLNTKDSEGNDSHPCHISATPAKKDEQTSSPGQHEYVRRYDGDTLDKSICHEKYAVETDGGENDDKDYQAWTSHLCGPDNTDSSVIHTHTHTRQHASLLRSELECDRKHPMREVPAFPCFNRTMYIVKERLSDAWHLLPAHPLIYLHRLSVYYNSQRQISGHALHDNRAYDENDNGNEVDFKEQRPRRSEPKNGNDSGTPNDSVIHATVMSDDGEPKENASPMVHEMVRRQNSVEEFGRLPDYDMESIIPISVLMLAALRSHMALQLCLLQPPLPRRFDAQTMDDVNSAATGSAVSSMLHPVQRWLRDDSEAGWAVLSPIYTARLGIIALEANRLPYSLPPMELDFNLFFTRNYLVASGIAPRLTPSFPTSTTTNAASANATTIYGSSPHTFQTRHSSASSLVSKRRLSCMSGKHSSNGNSHAAARQAVMERHKDALTAHMSERGRITMQRLLRAHILPARPLLHRRLNSWEGVQMALWLLMVVPQSVLRRWQAVGNEQKRCHERNDDDSAQYEDGAEEEEYMCEAVAHVVRRCRLRRGLGSEGDDGEKEEDTFLSDGDAAEDRKDKSNCQDEGNVGEWDQAALAQIATTELRKHLADGMTRARQRARQMHMSPETSSAKRRYFIPSELLWHTVCELRRRLARDENGLPPSQHALHLFLQDLLPLSSVRNTSAAITHTINDSDDDVRLNFTCMDQVDNRVGNKLSRKEQMDCLQWQSQHDPIVTEFMRVLCAESDDGPSLNCRTNSLIHTRASYNYYSAAFSSASSLTCVQKEDPTATPHQRRVLRQSDLVLLLLALTSTAAPRLAASTTSNAPSSHSAWASHVRPLSCSSSSVPVSAASSAGFGREKHTNLAVTTMLHDNKKESSSSPVSICRRRVTDGIGRGGDAHGEMFQCLLRYALATSSMCIGPTTTTTTTSSPSMAGLYDNDVHGSDAGGGSIHKSKEQVNINSFSPSLLVPASRESGVTHDSGTLLALFLALPRFREAATMRLLCQTTPVYHLFGPHDSCPLPLLIHVWSIDSGESIRASARTQINHPRHGEDGVAVSTSSASSPSCLPADKTRTRPAATALVVSSPSHQSPSRAGGMRISVTTSLAYVDIFVHHFWHELYFRCMDTSSSSAPPSSLRSTVTITSAVTPAEQSMVQYSAAAVAQMTREMRTVIEKTRMCYQQYVRHLELLSAARRTQHSRIQVRRAVQPPLAEYSLHDTGCHDYQNQSPHSHISPSQTTTATLAGEATPMRRGVGANGGGAPSGAMHKDTHHSDALRSEGARVTREATRAATHDPDDATHLSAKDSVETGMCGSFALACRARGARTSAPYASAASSHSAASVQTFPVALLRYNPLSKELQHEEQRVMAIWEALPMTPSSYLIPETLHALLYPDRPAELDVAAVLYLLKSGVTTVRRHPFCEVEVPALEHALRHGHREVARLLVELGCSLDGVTDQGARTLLSLARERLGDADAQLLASIDRLNQTASAADVRRCYGIRQAAHAV